MASPSVHIAAVRPLWAVEGARLTLEGEGFPVENAPRVSIGGIEARVAAVSATTLSLIVPQGLEGGRMPIRVEGAPGETAYVDVGIPAATGLHLVDSPVFDAEGNLYVTFSGSRGQQSAVSIFVVRPDGSREPDGSAAQVATGLGVACGIAFSPDGTLFVGDRSGSILRVIDGEVEPFAALPPSVAAYHLAFGPDGWLYVSVPTLNTRDAVYRVSRAGKTETFYEGFGRPQGLAFDAHGRLHVVDALAGAGGLYRFRAGPAGEPERLVAGATLIGVAFDPHGGVALASTDTVYRLDVRAAG